MISESTFVLSLFMDSMAVIIMFFNISLYGFTRINKVALPLIIILIIVSITAGVLSR